MPPVKRTRIDVSQEASPALSTGFDLNLLRVLLALGHTRHVTRAAELLQMSQSGFSTALARLRRQCGDPLFVRTAAGMLATPRAEAMLLRAAELLATVQSDVLAPLAFDPATATTEFSFSLTDVAEIVILPRLMAHLGEHAPATRASTHPLPDAELQDAMTAGQVGLAIGYFPKITGQDFFQQRLYQHTFACMVRRDHPLDRGQLTLAAYAALGHVLVTSPSRSGGLFHSTLEALGVQRRVVLRTPHYLSLPSIVEATDLIATVPLAAGVRFAERAAVKLVPLPFTPPVFGVQQHWHRRFHHDPRHCWLREQVATLFNDESDPWREAEEALYGKGLRRRGRRGGVGAAAAQGRQAAMAR